MFKNKYVKCNVDNISLVFAWANKTVKAENVLYKLFQIIHIIEYAIPCKIFIDHSPRRSSWETILVDNLTRKHTTTNADKKLIVNSKNYSLTGPLLKWITNPHTELNVMSIIDHIVDQCK